jgi:hypothetical protein
VNGLPLVLFASFVLWAMLAAIAYGIYSALA